jgi:hypothetical protein
VKALIFIFTLYLTALSVYPCYEDECLDEISMTCNAGQDDHEKEADLCTPFCISACCSIYYTPQFDCVLVFLKSMPENSTYIVTVTPQVVISIWQPPKLA